MPSAHSISNLSTPPSRGKLRIVLLLALVLTTFLGSHFIRQWIKSVPTPQVVVHDESHDYQRVIGLSPSIVEIIYQLGLEDRLVGVSRFCKYPPEANKKTVVGGYIDLDFETVLSLKPDCIILLEEQQGLADKLEAMGTHTIILDHASTQGVIDSISVIGKAFHKETMAKNIVHTMHTRINILTHRTRGLEKKPRILVCIDRDTNSDHPDRVIVAGNKGVHQEYITMLGGENAYDGPVAYPLVSRENLIHLNPDIIIDLIREDTWKEKGSDTLLKQWQAYGELKAVQNKRIVFLHEHKHMIPGPRFVDTLEIFAHAITQTP